MSLLKTLCNDNSNKLVFAHINVKSIRNNFEFLSIQVKSNINVSMVGLAILVGNFVKDGFSRLFQLDRDGNGGGIMLYVKGDIPSNLLAIDKKIP